MILYVCLCVWVNSNLRYIDLGWNWDLGPHLRGEEVET